MGRAIPVKYFLTTSAANGKNEATKELSPVYLLYELNRSWGSNVSVVLHRYDFIISTYSVQSQYHTFFFTG